MDPDATLSLIFEGYDTHDFDKARRAALDLLDWLRKGGFPPKVCGRFTVECNRFAARGICLAALSLESSY